MDMEMVVSNLLVVEDYSVVRTEEERTAMKVYIRRWRKDERNYVQEGPYEIDQYEGLSFSFKEEFTACTKLVLGRVRNMFLHAGEENALVVYVEEERVKP
jgi:hypothetical protein